MPIELATGVSNLVGGLWPIFSTFIGGLGAFVAGSNTVSNMMFSLFQFEVGNQIAVDPTWIVALQAVGDYGLSFLFKIVQYLSYSREKPRAIS